MFVCMCVCVCRPEVELFFSTVPPALLRLFLTDPGAHWFSQTSCQCAPDPSISTSLVFMFSNLGVITCTPNRAQPATPRAKPKVESRKVRLSHCGPWEEDGSFHWLSRMSGRTRFGARSSSPSSVRLRSQVREGDEG